MPSPRILRTAFLALLCGAEASSVQAVGRAECFSLDSKILKRSVPYCTLLPPSYDADRSRRYPVLYLLHGLGENEESFLRAGGINLVEDMWDQHTLGEFLIVTPNGDDSFYINSRDGRVLYEDFFLREFMPFIENRYRISPGRQFRGITGISMGGYGALHLAFRHASLFGSVSAHSAALMEAPPPVTAQNADGSLAVDREFWDENNPLELAKTARLNGLEIYFDCGSEDDYGFYQGAKTLDRELTLRHIPHEFHLYPGRHDWDYFAAQLPRSLAFHSKAFGWNPSGH
jgi:S-formylglutathione hydrolase FrmB